MKTAKDIYAEILGSLLLDDYLKDKIEMFQSCQLQDNFISGIVYIDENDTMLGKLLPQIISHIAVVINNNFGNECQVDYFVCDNLVKFSITNNMIKNIRSSNGRKTRTNN